MKKRHSLRFRIVFAFTAFAFVLGVFFALFLIGTMHFAHDMVVEQQLSGGVDFWKSRHGTSADPELPDLPFLKGYASLSDMPVGERQAVEAMPMGIHKFPCEGFDGDQFRWVNIFENRGQRYFFIYYSQAFFASSEGRTLGNLMLVGIFMITLLGFVIGKITARMVVKPVIDLADLVERTDPADLPAQLEYAESKYSDEVGFLARRLKTALDDVRAYNEREQRFTRYASHELRTPVAIIKGATELIALTDTKLASSRPLGRIQRSVNDMERLIETFLTLAREEKVEVNHPTHLTAVVGEAINRQLDQVRAKGVELSMRANADVQVPVPDTIVRVLVDNLLVNAIRHTDEGEVAVEIDEWGISVLDNGPGIPEETLLDIRREYVRGEDSQGYGMGLAIVEDLCRRYNWRFELENRDSRGLLARLSWVPLSATVSPAPV